MVFARPGSTVTIFSAGSGTPMMPVEEGKTCSGGQAKICAQAAQVARAASRPAWPAAQLALPALMAATRTLPPVARRCSLSTINGAAVTRLAVKTAAALAGASATMTAKSVRPLFLSPALTAPKRKPRGRKNCEESLIARIGINPFNLAGEGLDDGERIERGGSGGEM